MNTRVVLMVPSFAFVEIAVRRRQHVVIAGDPDIQREVERAVGNDTTAPALMPLPVISFV